MMRHDDAPHRASRLEADGEVSVETVVGTGDIRRAAVFELDDEAEFFGNNPALIRLDHGG